jgi:DNA invertase Pin-like site-specific DNA recombinase
MTNNQTSKAVPVAVLVRVSTSKQETTRQESELRAVADAKGWQVVEVVAEEGISGASKERPGIERILDLVRQGSIRKVLVHEVSRIGRRNSIVHSFIEELTEAKVSLYWHSQAIETLLANGKPNPAAGIMLAVLSEMARAERETLRERINSGLAEARRKGKTLGRPTGSSMTPAEFLASHKDIVKQLRAGQSVRNAAKITGKGASTVQRVKAVLGSDGGRVPA